MCIKFYAVELIINQKIKKFDNLPDSLGVLLESEFPNLGQYVAVAVNAKVVPRSNWFEIKLENKDSILIISPSQGG